MDVLDEELKEFMVRLAEKTMNEQDVKSILLTMNYTETDTMLLDCQSKYQMRILKRQLTKRGEWTSLSQAWIDNLSKKGRIDQCLRVIRNTKNLFADEDESDNLLVELLKNEQGHLVDGILEAFDAKSRIELFMQVIDSKMRANVINILEKEDIGAFWRNLKKTRQLELLLHLSEKDQFDFMVSKKKLS